MKAACFFCLLDIKNKTLKVTVISFNNIVIKVITISLQVMTVESGLSDKIMRKKC